MPKTTRTTKHIAAAALLMVAAISRVHSQENTGSVQQPLVGGSVIPRETQERLTLLTLNLSGAPVCSASLLRNDWAVTAAHCVDTPVPPRPAPRTGWMTQPANVISLAANWSKPQRRNAVAIYTFRPLDIAIIELDRPFSVHGSTWHFRQRLWSDGSYRNLMHYNFTMFGRGISQFAQPGIMSSNDNKYSVGYSKILRIDDGLYWFRDEARAAIAGGDSGGPSFTTEAASSGLIGVHARCTIQCVPGQICGDWPGPGPAPSNYRPWAWVAITPECADTPIEPAWDRIRQIMEARVPEAAPNMEARPMPYGAVRYIRPTITAENGLTHWLDGCRLWSRQCGQPAADAFCRKQDNSKPDAVSLKARNGAGITALISTGQLCRGPQCGGFEEIVCASRAHYTVTDHEALEDQRENLEPYKPVDVSPADPIVGTAQPGGATQAATATGSRVDPAATAIPARPLPQTTVLAPRHTTAMPATSAQSGSIQGTARQPPPAVAANVQAGELICQGGTTAAIGPYYQKAPDGADLQMMYFSPAGGAAAADGSGLVPGKCAFVDWAVADTGAGIILFKGTNANGEALRKSLESATNYWKFSVRKNSSGFYEASEYAEWRPTRSAAIDPERAEFEDIRINPGHDNVEFRFTGPEGSNPHLVIVNGPLKFNPDGTSSSEGKLLHLKPVQIAVTARSGIVEFVAISNRDRDIYASDEWLDLAPGRPYHYFLSRKYSANTQEGTFTTQGRFDPAGRQLEVERPSITNKSGKTTGPVNASPSQR